MTRRVSWAASQNGAPTNLEGVDDYVQSGAQSALALTNAGSFSAWIYPTGAGSQPTYGAIIINKEGEYEIAALLMAPFDGLCQHDPAL